ncbi:MAG: endonuclease III [Spirochaetaceae bacterium]|nr:endonuclease III [Spirochaetaceae bacterium]
MNEKEKIFVIYQILNQSSPIDIVFLERRESFQFLISVILSAQTTDKMVNIVVKDLFLKYPNARELANAPYDEVCNIVKRTGFYRNKARNIINCAKELVDKEVPADIDELIKLPGVGRKTANCILGDVYNKGAVIVDTHFKRVVNRLGIVDEKDPTKIEMLIRSKLEDKYLYRFSMIINLHGRRVCFARNPNCKNCKLRAICNWKDDDNQEENK